ncbi:glycosyltransferase family 25 protein [Microbacterium bandirmense]|uniref:glycosyltransferase family 25 protein n=1 Tax=Microbacterium bandirmense TaxID=3122050 RepID=UPI003B27BCC0
MRSVVINLPGAEARLAAFRAAERSVGLDSEVFSAVDGRSMAELPLHRHGLTPGEVGCVLSHQRLLRSVASEERDWVLVLEDDVLFWDDFGGQLERAEEDAGWQGARYVQLGWMPLTERPDHLRLCRDRIVANPKVRRASKIVRPRLRLSAPTVVSAEMGWGTHCYMVRTDFASVIADFLDGPRVHAPIDHYTPALQQIYPEFVFRARFSLAGQRWGQPSSTVSSRKFAPFQTDSAGNVRYAHK